MQLLEVVAVGLPYAVFKFLTGLRALEWFPGAPFVGWGLIALGVVDFFINTANFCGLLFLRRRVMDICFFAAAVRIAGRGARPDWLWHDLGISIDTLLAMSIVAYMIGTNRFALFPQAQLRVWNAAVVLNVLFAGFSRLFNSINRLSGGAAVERRVGF